MKSVDLERKLECGLVQAIFMPCAKALMGYLETLSPLARILDVGCGSGIAVRVAKERFASITTAHGLDFSANAIAIAKEVAKGGEFCFRVGNAETFTVKEPYDAILCQHTIQHVDEQGKAMRQMHVAMRRGGLLLLTAWPKLGDCPAYDFLYSAAGERAKKAVEFETTVEYLKELVWAAGLEVVVDTPKQEVDSQPLDPEHFLHQYLESSQGWEGKLWPKPSREEIYNLAKGRGWSTKLRTLTIGMNVVVARRPL